MCRENADRQRGKLTSANVAELATPGLVSATTTDGAPDPEGLSWHGPPVLPSHTHTPPVESVSNSHTHHPYRGCLTVTHHPYRGCLTVTHTTRTEGVQQSHTIKLPVQRVCNRQTQISYSCIEDV